MSAGASPEEAAKAAKRAQAKAQARRSGRTKILVDRWREHYARVFCGAVNHPTDPQRFPSVELEFASPGGSPDLVIRQNPKFPVVEIALAITKIVSGEEDGNWAAYREGAEYLLRFLDGRETRALLKPHLDVLEPASSRQQPPPPSWPGEELPPDLPILRIGYEDDYGMKLRLDLEVSDKDGAWSSSAWLVSEFLRYWLSHQSLLKLGGCHFEMCGRLYVKSGHRSSRQKYCCRSCRDKDYRLAKRQRLR